ncbi:MAG: NAD(P)-dependent alcohol dehydrogenase [Desulfobacteraceae bacterium]|nr:NAD(P)-dependent alcohol dehydrogenase [Desulfobacteraceae bacterium]
MKAIVYKKYGTPGVLKLNEVTKPTPKDNEVLVKIYATTVTAADCMMREAATLMGRVVLGFTKPKKKYQIMGIELAGVIEQVGKNVKRFKKGDEIFGFTGFAAGAYAEYKCLPESASIDIKPDELSYDESAAIVDGATTALFFMKDKGKIQKGEKILIIGASGSIGTAAVQLGKDFGAHVTGVCSGANVDLVKSLGADQVINYTQNDFTKNEEAYDMIFDTVGKSTFSKCKNILKPKGRYLITTGNFVKNTLMHFWTAIISGKRLISGMSVEKKKAILIVKELIAAGKLKPVIDRRYPLEQIVQAHEYVSKGHKKGNVVITVKHST